MRKVVILLCLVQLLFTPRCFGETTQGAGRQGGEKN